MQISMTFRHMTPTDAMKELIEDKVSKVKKYLHGPIEANVVLSVEKFRHTAEINIAGDRLTIIGKEETDDMYSAIDMALDKLEKQIKKSKEKIRERRSGGKNRSIELIDEDIELPDEDTVRQIKIKNIEYKPMDVEEAVMQMDLVSSNFLVFTNARSDKINVLYRRKDGHLGLIQPST